MEREDGSSVNYAELGHLHATLGIRQAHFAPMGEALIDSLSEKLGDRFTPELEAAWRAAYKSFSTKLIEAVNILGSLFYGAILGIFLIAFFFKRIGGHATFTAAIAAELGVLACHFFTEIPYLWFNVIGCVGLIILAHGLNPFFAARTRSTS